MIRTHQLTKRFGSLVAVDSVDLDVRPGDIYGFLGANGSGKTTTVRMLLGLVLATSGQIELFGQPMPGAGAEVLGRVGSLVEGPGAYGHLSGRANLLLLDASGNARARGARAGRTRPGGRRAGPGRPRPASAGGRSRPTRSACGNGWGWPRRCCASRNC